MMVRVCHFVYDCVGEEIVGCDEEIKRVAVGVSWGGDVLN